MTILNYALQKRYALKNGGKAREKTPVFQHIYLDFWIFMLHTIVNRNMKR